MKEYISTAYEMYEMPEPLTEPPKQIKEYLITFIPVGSQKTYNYVIWAENTKEAYFEFKKYLEGVVLNIIELG